MHGAEFLRYSCVSEECLYPYQKYVQFIPIGYPVGKNRIELVLGWCELVYSGILNPNWNTFLDQLSPIGNPIGVSRLDLIELELVGICFYQLEISPPNIFPIGKFISQQGPIGKTIFILFQCHQLDLVKNKLIALV